MRPLFRLGRTTRVAPVAMLVVLGAGVVTWAAGGALDDPVAVDQVAARAPYTSPDTVVIYDVGDVDQFVVEASARASSQAGAVFSTGRTGSLGMRSISRNGATVHAPPAGYLIPMIFVSVPTASVAYVLGSDVAAVLGPGKAVMNAVTASVTGTEVGDVVTVESTAGVPVRVEIVGIRSREQIGWAELVFTTDVASQLGFTQDTRVVIYGIDDRAAMEAALGAEGLIGRTDTSVSKSWDLRDPDDTISTAQIKQLFGEPWYRLDSDGSITMHPDWMAANLRPERELLNADIRIRARCHVGAVDDLRAALAEVAAAGLAAAIDVANANAYGGCFAGARLSRISGNVSRHSYGLALDTNTTSNCQGCVPRMNCQVVRIFRKHGFAWGGNFRRPDGMHFEWVGEPRDQLGYPSNYCPNLVNPQSQSIVTSTLGPDVLIDGYEAVDGIGHDHDHTP